MQDAITNVINQADVQGLYLDGSAIGRLEQYFTSGELRVRAAATISAARHPTAYSGSRHPH